MLKLSQLLFEFFSMASQRCHVRLDDKLKRAIFYTHTYFILISYLFLHFKQANRLNFRDNETRNRRQRQRHRISFGFEAEYDEIGICSECENDFIRPSGAYMI